MPTINLLRHNDFCSTTNTNISLSQAINFSNSADCNFVQLFGFWRRSPIWLVIDFFSTSCHSQLLLVVTAKIMFYVEILPFTWKRVKWENGKENSIPKLVILSWIWNVLAMQGFHLLDTWSSWLDFISCAWQFLATLSLNLT